MRQLFWPPDCNRASGARAQDISNTEIRDVVNRVARHQLIELRDADYAAASNMEKVKARSADAAPTNGDMFDIELRARMLM